MEGQTPSESEPLRDSAGASWNPHQPMSGVHSDLLDRLPAHLVHPSLWVFRHLNLNSGPLPIQPATHLWSPLCRPVPGPLSAAVRLPCRGGYPVRAEWIWVGLERICHAMPGRIPVRQASQPPIHAPACFLLPAWKGPAKLRLPQPVRLHSPAGV
jgi:hypothetical protein